MHTRQGVAEPALSQDSVRPNPSLTRSEAATPQLPPQFLSLKPDRDMYPIEHNLDGTVRHSRHCQALFGRRDWSCHRCCQLMVGAAPRKGWQREFFRRRLNQLQRRLLW